MEERACKIAAAGYAVISQYGVRRATMSDIAAAAGVSRQTIYNIFPNREAVIRLVGALMLEQNDEWAVSRRYMTLETLGSVSHNPIVSLPALAA